MTDNVLTALQGLAVVVTAIFTVLTVYAERGNDHKLSGKGKVTLAGAIAAGILAFGVLALQARSDRQKAHDQAAKTESLLRNIQRQLYPLFPQQQLTIDARWSIPTNQPDMLGYMTRVHRLVDPVIEGLMSTDEWCRQHGSSDEKKSACKFTFVYETVPEAGKAQHKGQLAWISFDPSSELYPRKSETGLHELLQVVGTRACFSKTAKKQICNNSDLEFTAATNTKIQLELDFDEVVPVLTVETENMAIERDIESTGVFTSVPDLSEAYLEIQYRDPVEVMSQAAIRIFESMTPGYVDFNIQGRKFFIGYKTQSPLRPPFTCRLQKGIENSLANVECTDF